MLESAIDFPRSNHRWSLNYFNLISISDDSRSALLISNDTTWNAKDSYLRIDLASGGYQNIKLGYAEFWYEYQGTVYGVGYNGYSSLRLFSVNVESGEIVVLSEVNDIPQLDIRRTLFQLKMKDVNTAVYLNTVISFSDRKIYSYDSNGQGIAYQNGRVVRGTSSGEVIISDVDGSDSITFPPYSDK